MVETLTKTSEFAFFLHKADKPSDKLVFCFGPRSSGLVSDGFGAKFVNSLGLDCVYVAQRKQSMYQGLSFEQFEKVAKPIADGRETYTYGVSVGAYAALYFAGAIHAKPVLAAPRCPGHPLAPSRFGHFPFNHKADLEYLPQTPHSPMVLVDPYCGVDARFVRDWVKPSYPGLTKVDVPGAGHLVLKHLKEKGVLSAFMASWFNDGVIAETSATDQGHSYRLHMQALKSIKHGDYDKGIQHLEASVQACPNKNNLKDLKKVAAEQDVASAGQAGMATRKTNLSIQNSVVGKKQIHAIAVCMRDEGQFLLEWVAFHRMIGFDKIFIVTNDCSDGTDKIAERLSQLDSVIHIPNQIAFGQSPQKQGMRRVLEHPEMGDVDWLMHCDADEFLDVSLGQGKVSDLTGNLPYSDAIAVCWHYMGNSGFQNWPEQLVTQNLVFGARAPRHYSCMHKTIFRPDKFAESIDHMPKRPRSRDIVLRNSAGEQLDPKSLFHPRHARYRGIGNAAYTWKNARLRHYAIRSEDVFLLKNVRGDGMQGQAVSSSRYKVNSVFWKKANNNSKKDVSMHRFAEGLEEYLTTYLQDDELRSLHHSAYLWFSDLRAKTLTPERRNDWTIPQD